MSIFQQYFQSPIGTIEITANNTMVESVLFVNEISEDRPNTITELTVIQLSEYFNNQRTAFTVPFNIVGSTFAKSVLHQVSEIGFGSTATYQHIASVLGNKNKVRAVGNINAKNQLLLIIPCHRVIGTNGKLIGYAGGLERKRWLLQHEGAIAQQSLF